MAAKYEVVPFDSGNGYFVSGGRLGSTFIEGKEDAELIAQALNQADALKLRRTALRVDDALSALASLQKRLAGDD